jgi:hypothetical protein
VLIRRAGGGGTVYALRVEGPNVAANTPEVAQFLDSLAIDDDEPIPDPDWQPYHPNGGRCTVLISASTDRASASSSASCSFAVRTAPAPSTLSVSRDRA